MDLYWQCLCFLICCLKKQIYHFAKKDLSNQSYGLFSSHVWIRELDNKQAPKNWYFWTVVLDKTLESALDSKEIKPVHPKGNKPWILIGRTDAEAESSVLWPPDASKDWRQKEKRATEKEMAGWHHQLNGCELGQTLGNGEGQESLASCSPWGWKELAMTWWLNNNHSSDSSSNKWSNSEW